MDQIRNLTERGSGKLVSKRLRQITGWALLASAIGTFYDSYACDGCAQGSVGLIPLYIGFPIGAFGLVIVLRRVAGKLAAFLGTLGLAGILYFMFWYPTAGDGWIGGVFIALAHLFLPFSGRFAALSWMAVGVLGFPEFPHRSWGPVEVFQMFGLATALSAAFVLWGLKSQEKNHE